MIQKDNLAALRHETDELKAMSKRLRRNSERLIEWSFRLERKLVRISNQRSNPLTRSERNDATGHNHQRG